MRILVELPGAARRYTYEAPDGTKVGDTVTVPGPPWDRRSPQQGTVVSLQSDYDGPVVSVIAPDDAAVPESWLGSWQRTYDYLRACMQGLDLLLSEPHPADPKWHEGCDRGRRRITAACAALAVYAVRPEDDKPPY